MILFLLFSYDVTICMKLDPGIHIGSTWFYFKTGCDISFTWTTMARYITVIPGA
uniref:Uncharacterized protein n=1 Tax=Setaria viridis TaxID=4556 RepID=A0A4U6SXH1_SETVI|nr:hypothetical protein SEVIR_9G142250v2 [Setaria viridis]